MGQAGMAEAAVRYLRSGRSLAVEALPRPELRCVREDERAPVEQAEFRRVLGSFASGVTVVTAPGASGGEPAGFACQSFSALSPAPPGGPRAVPPCQSFSALPLDPPLVAFMVGRTSTTWPRIAQAGVFCV